MKKNKHITINSLKKFEWHHITKNSKKEIAYLEKNFNFRQENLDDCLPPLQRPKILQYPEYIFMVLLFPYYDRRSREIKISEVDFFISKDSLVLVHDNKLQPLLDLQKKYSSKKAQKNITVTDFLYEVIESLLQYCFPMLNHVGLDIDDVEDRIFHDFGEENVRDILLVKHNIINFRKAMQAHRTVIAKLKSYIQQISNNKNTQALYENLYEQTKDIWDMLDNFKETIVALYNSNESLVSLRLSEIMKMLTIISVLTFPLTLFVALFSTNLAGTPFADHPFGFWIVVGLIIMGGSFMLYTFKSQRWF